MIPVLPQPAPSDFDTKVRLPGLKWLKGKSIPLNAPAPKGIVFKAYWSKTQKELWDAYKGTCAYLCIYFEWPLGASSTDHFVAKSQDAGQTYEWGNYRLSCLGMNRNKGKFDDILDPFTIQPNTFVLNFASGKVSPNPDPAFQSMYQQAQKTIDRLILNDPETQKMRVKHFDYYLTKQVTAEFLRNHSPFVWYEAQRQNLL
ncbi:TPA: hypothetical protein DDW35_11955 [Candidatus Sumerlaeota bacterium]|jgi:uncharacterized protein (TIGR02646 family)|nr:hypothetical protein [Candidatus Sumerlaeota bacterium]